MGFLQKIKNVIKQYIIQRATKHKAIDIVEVRTKQIGLLSVHSETDLLIKNSFFLPYTLLSIKTDLLNPDGIKVGKMTFEKPTRVKGNSELVFTTSSEISIITSLFQALSNLLSQTIRMRSVGTATVKILWFTIDLPVDDTFEIHPSKLKMLKDETEEEREARLQREAARKVKNEAEKEKRKSERSENRAAWKEEVLKRRYRENYIPKEQRMTGDEQLIVNDVPFIITNEEQDEHISLEIKLNEDAVLEIDKEESEEKTIENKED